MRISDWSSDVCSSDLLRIFVTNKLPEHTAVHWHGLHLPCGMDGVGGLTQPQIPPGKTFVYEFTVSRAGTFMYHPHADETVQMAMGRSEEHTSELQSLMRNSPDVFCLSEKIKTGDSTPKAG